MIGKVHILLPTYNGQRFLAELLASISAQTYSNIYFSIRDDGSSDGTCSVLSEWAAGRSNVSLHRGENLGVTNSFFYLLRNAAPECEYYAFCDQDDVWLPDKVERAARTLESCDLNTPAIYCSRVEYVDENLRHLGFSRIPKRIGFANALVENVAPGCTMVMNRKARTLICERLPQMTAPYDWWCYLVISALGKVFYDDEPNIKYRQHAMNVTGAASNRLELFRRRFNRFLQPSSGARLLSNQAVEFQRCFADLVSPRDKNVLERFLSVRGGLRDRISYSAIMDVWRQSWLDTMVLRALILVGRA